MSCIQMMFSVAAAAGGGGGTVATPSLSPAGGTFDDQSTVSVTLSSATAGADIRYTTDGSTPSSGSGTFYTGAFDVTASNAAVVVKAIAFKSGMADSAVASQTFSFTRVAGPTFSPSGGGFGDGGSATISLSSVTGGASIRYTTDGSTPSSGSGTLYSSPFTIGGISGDITVKAIAYAGGMTDGTVKSETYSFTSPSFTSSFDITNGGTGYAETDYNFSAAHTGATIEISVDGSVVASGTGHASLTTTFTGGGTTHTVTATSSLGGSYSATFVVYG